MKMEAFQFLIGAFVEYTRFFTAKKYSLRASLIRVLQYFMYTGRLR